MTARRRTNVPDRAGRPGRPRQDGHGNGHSPVRLSIATAVSIVAVAVVMWGRAQMQVSVRVVDSCTVGSAAGADETPCGAQSDNPAAGTAKPPLSGDRPPVAREEKTDAGITTFVF